MADEATKNKIRQTFDKLSAEDFQSVAGNKDGLADLVATKYGISKEEATKQVEAAFTK
jgi:tape measure domain-containing protein